MSQAGLETLAIVAYLGPVSRPDIARVRGVSADAGVAGLLERGLVEEAGRADTIGQPVLYRVTTAFARMFGLEDGHGEPAQPVRVRSHRRRSRGVAGTPSPGG